MIIIYISSGKKIHIGAKDDITISATNDLIFNVKQTFFGATSTERDDDGKLTKAEPMVLGQKLVTLLGDLIDCLSAGHFLPPPGGPPQPIIDKQMTPITSDGAGRKGLSTIQGELEGLMSKFHYLENNDEEKDPPPSNEGGGNAG